MATTAKKVAIIGSGNWGSAISKIIGNNVKKFDLFHDEVRMWVYEELIDGKKLTEIINSQHENVKYLPGITLPENVTAVPDLIEATKDADILVFVLPYQFLTKACEQLKVHIKPGAFAISLIKGICSGDDGFQLMSTIINKALGINVSVLMGANIAIEVAKEEFCETTIGAHNKDNGQVFYELFNTPYFRVTVISDSDSVEICGALKNIVAFAVGVCKGFGLGSNTKAAVIRIGMMEIIKFSRMFYKGTELSTFLESCGVADLITTCFGGRGQRVAEAMVRTGKAIDVLEAEILNGQKLQGPECAREVHILFKQRNLESEFPLFTAVYQICYEGLPPQQLLTKL